MKNFLKLICLIILTGNLCAADKAPQKKSPLTELSKALLFQESCENLEVVMIATIAHLGEICSKKEEYTKRIMASGNIPINERHQLYYEWIKILSEEASKIQNEKPGEVLFRVLMSQVFALKNKQNQSCIIM